MKNIQAGTELWLNVGPHAAIFGEVAVCKMQLSKGHLSGSEERPNRLWQRSFLCFCMNSASFRIKAELWHEMNSNNKNTFHQHRPELRANTDLSTSLPFLHYRFIDTLVQKSVIPLLITQKRSHKEKEKKRSIQSTPMIQQLVAPPSAAVVSCIISSWRNFFLLSNITSVHWAFWTFAYAQLLGTNNDLK